MTLDTALTKSATPGDQALLRFKVKAEGAAITLNRFTFTVATSNISGVGTSNSSTGFRLYSVTNQNFVSNATGAAAAYYLRNGGVSGANALDRNYADSTGTTLVVRTLVNNTTNYTNGLYPITSGAEHTFELWGNITDDATGGGSITVTLQGDDARPSAVSLTGASRKTMAKVSRVDTEQTQTACGSSGSPQSGAGGFVGAMSLTNASTSFIWSDLSSEATSSTNSNSCNTGDWMNGFKVPGLEPTGLSHTKAFSS